MEDIAQLRRSAVARLNKLSPYRLVQVINFIDFLLEPKSAVPRGSLEDLLACAGTWEFEPGELEEILQDIEQSRLMELEENDVSLPT
jgi:hypothetical protein